MTKTELLAERAEHLSELADICKRQAAVILAQRYVLEQFGAQVEEEEALAARNRLRGLVGDLDI